MEKFVKELLTENILMRISSRYKVERKALTFIGGFENYIYGFEKDNKSYVVRVSHSSHRDLEDIKSELDFVFYLATNGAKVSMPVLTIDQNLVEKIDASDGSYFIISAFTKAEGKAPKIEDFSTDFFINYGKVIGQFHRLTQNYTPSPGIKKRFVWYEDQVLVEADKYLDTNDKIILDRLKEVMDEIKKIPKTHENFGLIHTDVHMGNFFIKDNQFTVFDFDDASYHYFISDIAIFLYYLTWFTNEVDRLKYGNFFMINFMKGYKEEFNLSKEDFIHIDKFLKLREILLYINVYKTLDVEKDEFAKRYIERYRDKIINRVRFIELNFEDYI
ncbi:phosphotransferase [Acholeplasma equirhinis]|uniref:phosphotransferase enzyme family protein n=1 Tax=Acholeplasma equirhinis TaxID=555393 RepID=UPI00197A9114|nr:phosphotransferase [Acholeplasma equirhinis]MBN3490123.1 phosphotransferase [Acholeplasma equirhinis]